MTAFACLITLPLPSPIFPQLQSSLHYLIDLYANLFAHSPLSVWDTWIWGHVMAFLLLSCIPLSLPHPDPHSTVQNWLLSTANCPYNLLMALLSGVPMAVVCVAGISVMLF